MGETQRPTALEAVEALAEAVAQGLAETGLLVLRPLALFAEPEAEAVEAAELPEAPEARAVAVRVAAREAVPPTATHPVRVAQAAPESSTSSPIFKP